MSEMTEKNNLTEVTYHGCLKDGEYYLKEAGIEDAAIDAWLLFEQVFQISRMQYYMDLNKLCTQEQLEKYEMLISKRMQRIPLQHIIGTAPFMAYRFFVNEHVLTPRADTEILVERAFDVMQQQSITAYKEKRPVRILDMCTGSGCIAISLACMAQEAGIACDVTAVDLSEEALKVAAKNNENLCEGHVKLLQGDLFEALSDTQEFDIIVSNPPYIKSEEIETLMPEVRDHEPRMALDGTADGLYFYRKLADEGRKYLKNKGCMLLEIGYDQGETVPEILEANGFTHIQVIKDLAGLDRVVVSWKE